MKAKTPKVSTTVKDKQTDVEWEASDVSATSTTKLEQDEGTGQAVVIRAFDFGANMEAWRAKPPTKQELFNHHLKGIESLLWRDGLKPFDDVEPRLIYSKDGNHYRIIVTAIQAKGSILKEIPLTLSQIAHG